jgi:hypothetical protein
MRNAFVALALSAAVVSSAAFAADTPATGTAASVLRRADWQKQGFETFLPPPTAQPPWLAGGPQPKWKLPQGDFPTGREATVASFRLPASASGQQDSSKLAPTTDGRAVR